MCVLLLLLVSHIAVSKSDILIANLYQKEAAVCGAAV